MKFFFKFLVDVCERPPPLHGVNLNSSDFTFGSVVMANCDEGLTFTKDNNTVYIQCMEGSVWNATLQPCKGENKFHEIFTQICEHLL